MGSLKKELTKIQFGDKSDNEKAKEKVSQVDEEGDFESADDSLVREIKADTGKRKENNEEKKDFKITQDQSFDQPLKIKTKSEDNIIEVDESQIEDSSLFPEEINSSPVNPLQFLKSQSPTEGNKSPHIPSNP
jgi:hypothetical protein